MQTVRELFARRHYSHEPRLCFVLMPFRQSLTEVYREVIQPTLTESCGMKCVRADEIYSEQAVMGDIWEYIQRAEIIVADLTDKNSNVFYELGLSHAIWKRVILLAQRMDDVPFDLRPFRVIVYKHTISGAKKLAQDLAKAALALRSAQADMEISFPKDGQNIYGEIAVEGKFTRRPKNTDVRGFVASVHDERIWPQGSVVFDSKCKTWRCMVNLWEHPKPDAYIFVAELGEASRILCDYYGVVGSKSMWIPLRRLTSDAVEYCRIRVVNGFEPK